MTEEGPPNTSTAERIERVRQRIADAARRAGRDGDHVVLMAVSKRQSLSAILAAARAGVCDFGENYVQEAEEKIGGVETPEGLRWHLIGGLQRNKARRAVALFQTIQSVDGAPLAQAIARSAAEAEKVQRVLIEVNLSGDPGRSGVDPGDARNLWERVIDLEWLDLEGLMGVAPLEGGSDSARASFAALRKLFEALPEKNRRTLSMGMSGDFEIAVEEGATQVRIGTALFGARSHQA